jgi:hypothetical protein
MDKDGKPSGWQPQSEADHFITCTIWTQSGHVAMRRPVATLDLTSRLSPIRVGPRAIEQ